LAAVPQLGRAAGVEQHVAPGAAATEDLYERYSRQIYAFCLHQLGNREEAEDAVQTTFLNAFRGLSRGISPDAEVAWLYKIAQNVCLTRRRSTYRRGRVETPGDIQALQDFVAAPQRMGADELIELQEALAGMPANQRKAILLREWRGLSYHEIADEMGISQAAVETLIFRARRSLAQGLEQAPAERKKLLQRLRHGVDVGALLAMIKGMIAGGAAVKAVATTAAVTTTAAAVAALPSDERLPRRAAVDRPAVAEKAEPAPVRAPAPVAPRADVPAATRAPRPAEPRKTVAAAKPAAKPKTPAAPAAPVAEQRAAAITAPAPEPVAPVVEEPRAAQPKAERAEKAEKANAEQPRREQRDVEQPKAKEPNDERTSAGKQEKPLEPKGQAKKDEPVQLQPPVQTASPAPAVASPAPVTPPPVAEPSKQEAKAEAKEQRAEDRAAANDETAAAPAPEFSQHEDKGKSGKP
jgi:RNA polymerase sigma-70 factor (ECF subfamily)